MSQVELHLGDCLDVMAGMADNSIDTVITDPPYELGFMNKAFDKTGISFRPETWAAMLRVAKPGAILMAFGGTRTWHRIAVAIEDAGWEIKDTIMWVYSQGFPKATSISKQLDKAAGATREVIRHNPNGRPNMVGVDCAVYSKRVDNNITAPATPLATLWDGWYSPGLKPAWEPVIVAMKPLDGTYSANAQKWGVAGLWIEGARIDASEADRMDSARPNCVGKQYHTNTYGNGKCGMTGVPPAGRWPANLIHDGSDEVLAAFPQSDRGGKERSGTGAPYNGLANSGKAFKQAVPKYHDFGDSGSAARFFQCCPPDEPRARPKPSPHMVACQVCESTGTLVTYDTDGEPESEIACPDCGGTGYVPSRLCYAAKASRSEREAGLEEMPKKERHTQGRDIVTSIDRRDGKGRVPVNGKIQPAANDHPCIKPLSLMRYLVRLTRTPAGGTVLDPFAGSGTTLVACVLEGRDGIGIELDADYYEIARRRVAHAQMQPALMEVTA